MISESTRMRSVRIAEIIPKYSSPKSFMDSAPTPAEPMVWAMVLSERIAPTGRSTLFCTVSSEWQFYCLVSPSSKWKIWEWKEVPPPGRNIKRTVTEHLKNIIRLSPLKWLFVNNMLSVSKWDNLLNTKIPMEDVMRHTTSMNDEWVNRMFTVNGIS